MGSRRRAHFHTEPSWKSSLQIWGRGSFRVPPELTPWLQSGPLTASPSPAPSWRGPGLRAGPGWGRVLTCCAAVALTTATRWRTCRARLRGCTPKHWAQSSWRSCAASRWVRSQLPPPSECSSSPGWGPGPGEKGRGSLCPDKGAEGWGMGTPPADPWLLGPWTDPDRRLKAQKELQ